VEEMMSDGGDGGALGAAPAAAPSPTSVVSTPIQLSRVTARRCGGRISTILGKPATFADPWFFTADDDLTYVVKVASSKDRSAFNEAVFGRLARHVELPVPEMAAILVPPDLIADDPQLSAVGFPAGVHVGVSRLPNGSFDLRGDILTTLGPSIQIENEDRLPATVVYSSWIHDGDHRGNDGNWMLEPKDDNKFAAWVIDFGHSLGGPGWTAAYLQSIADPNSVLQLGPHRIAAKACAAPGAFASALNRVDNITPDQLAELVGTVPTDWEPPAGERAEVGRALVSRRTGVDNLFKAKS
jgi:hypothetical protein